MIYKPINYYMFSRSDVITELTIAGRSFSSFDDADCPVHAANEQPESEAPYVVWNYARHVDRSRWWIQEQRMAYWLWDINLARLTRLEDAMIGHIVQMDESAQVMNDWWRDNGFTDHKALYTSFTASEPIQPQRQEGGVVGKLLRFSVYYVDC